VDDIVDECKEAHIARVKLQWWRETIRQTFQGNPTHPVQHALHQAIERYNLPEEHFLEIIDGMEMDLDQHRYPTFKALSLYCYRAACVVGLLAAEIFGYENHNTQKYAYNLGMALQLTNILRDVKEDAARDRIYLPQDELQRFNVREDDILQARVNENVLKLLQHQAQKAQSYYELAYSHLSEEDRYRQISGVIMAAIYRQVLEKIKANHYDVFQKRITLSPPRKLWLAWNTARKERLRHQKYLQTCES
jgi:phytoene synthase